MRDEVLDEAEAGTGTRPLLGGRLAGPGGLYNLGNGIGLLGGLALAVAAQAEDAGLSVSGGPAAAWQHLAGNMGALAISVAMLMFFWSGEQYHRAWSRGFPPDARLNRLGDLWSGHGALALGLGLFLTGQPLLAATAGLMHAAGKFGSAFGVRRALSLGGPSLDLYRWSCWRAPCPPLPLCFWRSARPPMPPPWPRRFFS